MEIHVNENEQLFDFIKDLSFDQLKAAIIETIKQSKDAKEAAAKCFTGWRAMEMKTKQGA